MTKIDEKSSSMQPPFNEHESNSRRYSMGKLMEPDQLPNRGRLERINQLKVLVYYANIRRGQVRLLK